MRMKLTEVSGDILAFPDHFTILHCISADYRMMGLAVELDRTRGISRVLNAKGFGNCPDCIYTPGVLNLVVRHRYEEETHLDNIVRSLEICKAVCDHEDIKSIVMPPINSGFNGPTWREVKEKMMGIFKDTNIDLFVVFKPNGK